MIKEKEVDPLAAIRKSCPNDPRWEEVDRLRATGKEVDHLISNGIVMEIRLGATTNRQTVRKNHR